MVAAAFNFNDPSSPLTFDETNDAYMISIQLQCQRDKVAVEVKGKSTVRISGSDGNDAVMYEVVMPKDVKLEDTAADFDGGTLTVTVPKRAGLALLRPGLSNRSIRIS